MKKCPYCQKEPTKYYGNHFYKCAPTGKDKLEIKYECIVYNFPIMTKEFLYIEYIENQLSLPKLKSKYGIGYKDTIFLLDYYNIKKRNMSEGALICAEEKASTNLKKYGHRNLLGGSSILIEKRNKTLLEKYGVDNVFKLQEFQDMSTNEDTFKERYGVSRRELASFNSKKLWESKSKEERELWLNKSIRSKRPEKISNLEKSIGSLLIDLELSFQAQYYIKPYWFDFKIGNLLIEVNGDYWHCNPNIYLPDDIVIMNGKHILVSDKWNYDYIKLTIAEELGYKVEYLWEDWIRANKEEDIKKHILRLIKDYA